MDAQALFPAGNAFPEFPELEFPSPVPVSKNYERSLVAELNVGVLIPILEFEPLNVNDSPSFDTLKTPRGLYVVAFVDDTDASLHLSKVYDAYTAQDPHGTLGYPLPHWMLLGGQSQGLPTATSLLVVSASAIKTRRLPPAALTCLADLGITPTSPSLLLLDAEKRAIAAAAALSHKEKQLDIASAPFRRALHGDEAKFSALVGAERDIYGVRFMSRMRNSVLQRLPNLPFTHAEYFEAFLAFRWGFEVTPFSKKSMDCHLALFMPMDKNGGSHIFVNVTEIQTALVNVQAACSTVFHEEPGQPFFASVFTPVHTKLSSSAPDESLGSIPIAYTVWYISSMLVRWAALYIDPALAQAKYADFLASNLSVMSYIPTELKMAFAVTDVSRLPILKSVPLTTVSRTGNSYSSPTSDRPNVRLNKDKGGNGKRSPGDRPAHSGSGQRAVKVAKGATGNASGAGTGSTGKHVCVTAFCHALDPGKFHACSNTSGPGGTCPRIHGLKPDASGVVSAEVKNEVLTSLKLMKGQRVPDMIAAVHALRT